MKSVSDDVRRNLDTQSRRLEKANAAADALLRDEEIAYEQPFGDPVFSYTELTQANDVLRSKNAWTEIDLEKALPPEVKAQLDGWREHQRIPWSGGDLATVGLAGLLGAMACIFDSQIDSAVREGMGWLKGTDLFQGWEQDARRMPIDYTGPKFGGPGHRMRSAGHDIGRPFAALRQIRGGYFEGLVWEERAASTFRTAAGSYAPVASIGAALVLWLKHLMADVVTPMSLPLPAFTRLYELPNRDLRKLAHQMYDGTQWGTGYNMRSGVISPLLSVMLVDIMIRMQCHWRAYSEHKQFRLTTAEAAKRNEMLLAAQGVVGAASIGTAVFYLHLEGPFALRHINLPAMTRTGFAAVKVYSDSLARKGTQPPTWGELAAQTAPWELDWVKVLEEQAKGPAAV